MSSASGNALVAVRHAGAEHLGVEGVVPNPAIISGKDNATADEGSCRLDAASQLQIDQIQSASPVLVARLKALSGHGADLGVWETPFRWLTHGNRIDSFGSVLLRSAARAGLASVDGFDSGHSSGERFDLSGVPSSIPERLIEDVLTQANRYLLLLRLGPSARTTRHTGRASLKASVIAGIAGGALRRMLEIVVRRRLELISQGLLAAEDRRYFALIRTCDVDRLPLTFARGCRAELRRMYQLAGRELWADIAPLEQAPNATVDPKLSKRAVKDSGSPDPHLPLPDDYVALMGQRSLWIAEHLGPALTEIGDRMLYGWKAAAERGRVSKNTRKQIALKCISAYFGKSEDDRSLLSAPIHNPPFKILLSTNGETSGRRLVNLRKTGSAKTSEANSTRPEEDATFVDAEADLDSIEALAWPPRNLAHYFGLCAVLQGAHFFLVSMALAARASESMDLQRNCVIYGSDGNHRALSRTFKLVHMFEGQTRDWELPDAAVRAIEQQARLVRLLEQMPWGGNLSVLRDPEYSGFEGNHLWCRLGTGKTAPREILRNPNKLLRRYARALDMETDPGGQTLRTHRFRKTIARLGALAVDEAPVMLKALFGHNDIEMTLRYILADKGLAAEVEQVIKELRMMRARAPVSAFVDAMNKRSKAVDTGGRDGVDAVDYAGYGGGAVARIQDTIARYRDQALSGRRMRNSLYDFGAEKIDDVVRILTADGTYFEAVRPGIVCTKRLGEWGPCSRNKGQPDRSNCVETCGYRLEEPWHRRDVEASISDAIERYERAHAENDVLLASFWAEQLRKNVVRFGDLRHKWMQHPIVGMLMTPTKGEVGKAA